MNVRWALLAGIMAVAGCANADIGTSKTASAGDVTRAGYVTEMHDGRLWVFVEGSKAYKDFKAKGEPAKVVTRIGEGPGGLTLKSVDAETLDGYMVSKPGYVSLVHDGRLWVFKAGSKDYEDFKAKGEPAKVVTRIGEGPNGMTIKSVDGETIDGYLAKK